MKIDKRKMINIGLILVVIGGLMYLFESPLTPENQLKCEFERLKIYLFQLVALVIVALGHCIKEE